MSAKIKRSILISLCGFLLLAIIGYLSLERFKYQLYEASINAQEKEIRLEKHSLQTNGFTWSYLENDMRGVKPSLIMVHGFGASKEAWLATATQLKDQFHLILVDLPGHGESTFDTNQHYDLASQTEQLHGFISALGLTSFHMIGNSMGGGIAGLYANNYPKEVLSAILLDPAGIVDAKSEYQRYLDRGENPLIVKTTQDLDFLYGFAVAKKISIWWPFNEVLVEKALALKSEHDRVFADVTSPPRYDFKAAIKSISSPVLVVWGKQDRIISPDNAAVYHQLNPSIEVKMLENIGHIPMVEDPVLCAGLIKGFASKIAL